MLSLPAGARPVRRGGGGLNLEGQEEGWGAGGLFLHSLVSSRVSEGEKSRWSQAGEGAPWGELVGRAGREGRLSEGSKRALFWPTDPSRRCVQLLRGHVGDQWTWFWSCTGSDGSRLARACFQQTRQGRVDALMFLELGHLSRSVSGGDRQTGGCGRGSAQRCDGFNPQVFLNKEERIDGQDLKIRKSLRSQVSGSFEKLKLRRLRALVPTRRPRGSPTPAAGRVRRPLPSPSQTAGV